MYLGYLLNDLYVSNHGSDRPCVVHELFTIDSNNSTNIKICKTTERYKETMESSVTKGKGSYKDDTEDQ